MLHSPLNLGLRDPGHCFPTLLPNKQLQQLFIGKSNLSVPHFHICRMGIMTFFFTKHFVINRWKHSNTSLFSPCQAFSMQAHLYYSCLKDAREKYFSNTMLKLFFFAIPCCCCSIFCWQYPVWLVLNKQEWYLHLLGEGLPSNCNQRVFYPHWSTVN